jgi:hypothetical protein
MERTVMSTVSTVNSLGNAPSNNSGMTGEIASNLENPSLLRIK